MAVTHNLKIGYERLRNLIAGRKKVEVRFNDRDYQRGDFLRFNQNHEDHPSDCYFKITHIHSGLGMAEGYVALSVEIV